MTIGELLICLFLMFILGFHIGKEIESLRK